MAEEKAASTSHEDGKMVEEIPSNGDGAMAEVPRAHDVEDDDTFSHYITQNIFHVVTSGTVPALTDALSQLELGTYKNA